MTLRLPLAVMVACSAFPAHAQDASDIVITGRGLNSRLGDKAFDIITLDRARIEAVASDRVESVLADVAGIQQFRRSDSRSANPTSQGISLRGIGGNASSRALLVLDGVPQADPFGGWVAFPAYATGRLESIRVTRGGGSGYYGAGALAGTIELESAGPGTATPLSADFAYGSRNSIDASASAGLQRSGGFATVSAAYARGSGFIPTSTESRGPVDRPAPYEQASGALRAVVAAGGGTELQANLAAFTDTRERGTAFTRNRSAGADASVRVVHHGRWGASALAYVQTRAFVSQFASVNPARTAAAQVLDQYNTPATGLGARIEVIPPLGRNVDVRLGADLRQVSGQTHERFFYVAAQPTRLRQAGGETRSTGLFADGSMSVGPMTLTLGGRIDWWDITNGFLRERAIASGATLRNAAFTRRDGSEATGRTGIAWTIAPPLTLRAAAYRGWRLPTLNELYRPFRVGADATAANADLTPERLTGIDGGFTFTPATDIAVNASWFWNRLDDAIANVTVGRGPGTFPGVGFVGSGGVYRVRQNLDAIRSTGIEIDAQASRGPIFATASWSHVNPRIVASGAATPLDALRPAQTPLYYCI